MWIFKKLSSNTVLRLGTAYERLFSQQKIILKGNVIQRKVIRMKEIQEALKRNYVFCSKALFFFQTGLYKCY